MRKLLSVIDIDCKKYNDFCFELEDSGVLFRH